MRINEIDKLLDDGTFKNLDEYKDTMYDAAKFLGHVCNSRCLVKTPTGEFRCQKVNYLKVSEDNTKHTYMEFNNEISKDCLDRLI